MRTPNGRLRVLAGALATLWLPLLSTTAALAGETTAEKELRLRLAEACEKAGNDLAVAVKDNAKKTKRSYQCVKDGKIEGTHTGVYLPGLEKESSGQICDGTVCGRWERWDRSGALIDSGEWQNGIPHGDWTFYRTGPGVSPGTRKEFGRLLNGQKTCGWTILDSYGGVDEAASAAFCSPSGNQASSSGVATEGMRASSFRSNLRLGVGLGYSFFSSNERNLQFSMQTLTPKLGARYRLGDSFSLSLSAFLTAVNLSTSHPDTKVQVFGSNLRLDYRAAFRLGPVIPALAAGLSYGRMFVSRADFGYANLLYPQIFPSLTWPAVLGTFALYGKYVPMGGNLQTTPTRELAWGLSFEPRFSGKSSGWSLSIDYSDLRVRPGDRFLISTNTVTVGLGLLL